jgi:hypothetical protein
MRWVDAPSTGNASPKKQGIGFLGVLGSAIIGWGIGGMLFGKGKHGSGDCGCDD